MTYFSWIDTNKDGLAGLAGGHICKYEVRTYVRLKGNNLFYLSYFVKTGLKVVICVLKCVATQAC